MADQYKLDEDSIGSVSGKKKRTSATSDFDALSAELNANRRRKTAPSFETEDFAEDDHFVNKKSRQTTPTTRVRQAAPRRNWAAIIICLLLVLLIAVGGAGYYFWTQMNADPYGGRILENVTIAGVNVGGMSKEEAIQLLNSSVQNSYTEQDMVVIFNGQEILLPPSLTHAKLNTASAVDAAYVISRTADDGDTTVKNVPLATHLGLDTGAIRTTIKENCAVISGEYIPSSYALVGTMPALDAEHFDESAPCQTLELTIGTPGGKIDVDTIYTKVMEAYNCNRFLVEVNGDNMMQQPEALDLDAIAQEVCIDAVPVSADNPGSVGYTFSFENAQEQLNNAVYGDVISIQMEYDIPVGFGTDPDYPNVISSYSTPINGSKNYIKNLQNFCKLINGRILKPSDLLSLDLDYPRNKDNGFVSAEIHPGQCSTKKMGGGEDQFATTLCVSAVMADLSINQRHSAHHFCTFASDIPGSELSVRRNTEDLKISNPFDYEVMIQAKVTDSELTIRFLAKNARNYTTKLESETLYPISFSTNYIEKTAAEGYTDQEVIQEGINGASIHLFRAKYDAATNNLISRSSELFLEVPALQRQVAIVR